MGPGDTNCLDKKNLTFFNYNRKIKEISTEPTTPHMECNNNLHPVDFISKTNYIRKTQCRKNQNNKGMYILLISLYI